MNILDTIGNTPLIKLTRLAEAAGVNIWAKAEFANPSGSVKDRAAYAMISDGIRRGAITKDKIIIDATSGNTGISYAMIGAALGYAVRLYLPKNASVERKNIMRNYGAAIIETSPLEGSDGAYLAANREFEAHPEKYFYPNQYNNPVNPLAHYNATGVEIWEQSGHKVTHFITGTGTSGTLMGVSRRLKEYNHDIITAAVQPDSPLHGIEGTKHIPSTIKPAICDLSAVDRIISVSTDEAYRTTRRLAREEGIFAGISSGANVAAALKLARTAPPDSFIVTVLCDGGTRYLSDAFWETP